jgi:hypothetical protein
MKRIKTLTPTLVTETLRATADAKTPPPVTACPQTQPPPVRKIKKS